MELRGEHSPDEPVEYTVNGVTLRLNNNDAEGATIELSDQNRKVRLLRLDKLVDAGAVFNLAMILAGKNIPFAEICTECIQRYPGVS